jgi:hypothetical protein
LIIINLYILSVMQDPEEPPIDFNPPEHQDFDGSLGGSADDLMDIVENISP